MYYLENLYQSAFVEELLLPSTFSKTLIVKKNALKTLMKGDLTL